MGLFSCGFSLIFLQLVLNWHLGPVLHSSELPWLLLSCTAVLGQAAGYGWRTQRWPQLFLVFTLLAPSLAALLRILQAHAWLTLFLSAALAVCSSFPLAYLISQLWRGERLRNFYRLELSGALAALLTALLLTPSLCTHLFAWAVLASAWGLLSKVGRGMALLLSLLQSILFPQVRWWAAQAAYGPDRLVAQEVSPYQYVEVVEATDATGSRYLFLNGLCHYGPDAYNRLNFYLGPMAASRLPQSARQAGCLVLGAGTFLAPALVAEQGLKTTVLELDPAVAKLGLDWFREARPAGDHFSTLTGDARVLLRQQPETGLVVINLPSPYSLNVASMFTKEFYQSVRARLVTGGVCSVFLGAPLDPSSVSPVQGPILAALLEAFPEAMAVSGRNFDNTVVLVSSEPLGEASDLRRYLRAQGKNRFTIYTRPQLKEMARGFEPSSFNNLSICAALNRILWEIP
ncbi:hypothetical protein JST97_32265 [bacterium]|nr:hypothetical protein [bacterium]